MSDELTVTRKALAVTADIAVGPEGIPGLQAQLLEWAKAKLVEVQAEHKDMAEAHQHAKERKWKASALLTAANKALKRVQFYEKVVAAIEDGYMLFPPIDNIDLIAVRVINENHSGSDFVDVPSYWSTPGQYQTESDFPPVGEGSYKHPLRRWSRSGSKFKDDKGNEKQTWFSKDLMDDPEFPLVMARSQCIDATTAAMERKFFDDIAIYPARARKDPVIIGRIHDPKGRILNFLISWRVDKRDI